MASQTNIAHTSFLEQCISKKRSVRDCYEAIGLFSVTSEIRKDPVFYQDEANQLQDRIKEIAASFKASHRNGRKSVPEMLVEDGMFAVETRQLGQTYGAVLWGEADKPPTQYGEQNGASLGELKWNKEADRSTILYYIRCWITGHVVQSRNPPKGKQRASTTVIDLVGEDSDDEDSHSPPQEEATASAILPFRAPTAPPMTTSINNSGPEHTTIAAAPADAGRPDPNVTKPRSPITPTKRKALGAQGQTASGKLQKVNKQTHASGGTLKGRQRDVYTGPPSTSPDLLITPSAPAQGGGTSDTDSLYAPPRDATVETETVFDPDEMMQDIGDLARAPTALDAYMHLGSPSAGPSGTYRNPHRHDPVGLSIQDTSYHPPREVALEPAQATPTSATPIPHQQIYISDLPSPHQLRHLRNELFTLILSYLNQINDFTSTSYNPDAEQRLDHLLSHFWLTMSSASAPHSWTESLGFKIYGTAG
ncbi:hypothetical protein DE146DRAFT_19952 [Phaeosphaeria sp. MPI-PUGE-AT-0046c]|nr:hypothetical protein DE146DRAFT_19952 [Phaeosphaeria sp. MPI-PUGE-AT-0046c]